MARPLRGGREGRAWPLRKKNLFEAQKKLPKKCGHYVRGRGNKALMAGPLKNNLILVYLQRVMQA